MRFHWESIWQDDSSSRSIHDKQNGVGLYAWEGVRRLMIPRRCQRAARLRRAALSSAAMQMMNTIEYRVDCQLLQYLHHENNLGCR
jgi:hypothetical protein